MCWGLSHVRPVSQLEEARGRRGSLDELELLGEYVRKGFVHTQAAFGECAVVSHAGNSVPHSCLLTLHWVEERIGRVKVRKLIGWHKDSFIGKAKAVHTNKVNQGINFPLPIICQVFSYPQESRAPSHVAVIWEGKHHQSCCQLYILSLTSHGMGYALVRWGHLSKLCPLPTACAPPV